MAVAKTPFMVQRGFLSPLLCETIVDQIRLDSVDTDQEGHPIKRTRHHDDAEAAIFERLQPLIPSLEKHYDFDYRGTERITFEFYPEGCISEPQCENSNYIRKKWVRTKDRDFTSILFLCDEQEQIPFDGDFEVYGGKLEFPQHQFGFNPERGTLVTFPSGPHFINAVAPIFAGDLYMVRIHMSTMLPFLYQPADFPGDYRSWFVGL